MYEISELKVFENIKFIGEIPLLMEKSLLVKGLSSMIVEVIRTNFRLLFFFTRKFYKHKKHKNAHKQTKNIFYAHKNILKK